MQATLESDRFPTSLATAVLAADRRALARLLTQVENGTSEGEVAINELFRHGGKAHLVGITGSPGCGKSSLVSQLAHHYRHPPSGENPRQVAVVAVDPSSPFSGGAVLGDRVRMRDLAGDPGIFIRSMASRGALGGLAHTTQAVAQVLDAAGFEIILIETVGAGQTEVEIATLAHTTLVVEAPGMGDDIQAIKAGLMEIADILVVNKADRPGVEATERALLAMVEAYRDGKPEPCETQPDIGACQVWMPPVVATIATLGTGIADLAQAIDAHANYLRQSGEWERRAINRLQIDLESRLREALYAEWRAHLEDGLYQKTLNEILSRRLSPQEAVTLLVNR